MTLDKIEQDIKYIVKHTTPLTWKVHFNKEKNVDTITEYYLDSRGVVNPSVFWYEGVISKKRGCGPTNEHNGCACTGACKEIVPADQLDIMLSKLYEEAYDYVWYVVDEVMNDKT